MELELQHQTLNYYDELLETTVFQEETTESIVPDAYPDVLRILDTRAQAFLTGKQVRESGVTISGQLQACVFYLPESGARVCRLEITQPFTCQIEVPGLGAQGTVFACPRVRWSEARPLNPRKLLLRVDLAIDVHAFQPGEATLCSGISDGEQYGVCQLCNTKDVYLTSVVQEKPFSFSDSIEFGGTAHKQLEILHIQANPHCTEHKLIGNKLIFKGVVELDALVWDGEELRNDRQLLSYSQIMEIIGAGDLCICEIRTPLTDLNWQKDESRGGGEITLEFVAQAVVRECRQMTLLSDLYSTSHKTEVCTVQYQFQDTLEMSSRTIPVRELIETTTLVRTAVHCWADLGEVTISSETDSPAVSAQVQLNGMYRDDDEQLQTICKTVTVICRLDLPVGGSCQCWCDAPKELFVSPAAGGLEVRFSLDFHLRFHHQQRVGVVSAASLAEELSSEEGERPSVILRLAESGERLWDLAKHYGTTMAEIAQANGLESDILPKGSMLLIPKVR